MKFAIFATLAAIAFTVVGAATLEARKPESAAVCSSPPVCSLAGTITIQGVTADLPSMDSECCAGTTCSLVTPVNDLLDLSGLLGSVLSVLELVLSLGGLAGIPGLSTVISLIESLLSALPLGLTTGLTNGLIGNLVNSLGTVNAQATVSYCCSFDSSLADLFGRSALKRTIYGRLTTVVTACNDWMYAQCVL